MGRDRRSSFSLRASLKPFGIGEQRPNNFGEVTRAIWENRDQAGYAWRILNEGVCDGCALGTKGMRDWTIDGVHLCNIRLRLLRLNTMPAFDPAVLADVEALRGRSSARAARARAACRARWCAARATPASRPIALGRGARPHGRADPRRRPRPPGRLPHQPRHRQRDLLRRAEGRARDGLQRDRQRRARVPLAQHVRAEGGDRRRAPPPAPTPTG